jgi:hypothetical protein
MTDSSWRVAPRIATSRHLEFAGTEQANARHSEKSTSAHAGALIICEKYCCSVYSGCNRASPAQPGRCIRLQNRPRQQSHHMTQLGTRKLNKIVNKTQKRIRYRHIFSTSIEWEIQCSILVQIRGRISNMGRYVRTCPSCPCIDVAPYTAEHFHRHYTNLIRQAPDNVAFL